MIIEIHPEVEHGVKTMRINSRDELFYEAFVQAASALTEIIKSTEHQDEFENLYGYPNNLIAFCGKRGQGKTSAMLSFSDALKDKDKTCFQNFENDKFAEIAKADFFVLPAIDPTILEEQENILNVILSRLFLRVQEEWKNGDERRRGFDESTRSKLIEKFQICMDGVAAIKGTQSLSAFDSLEKLERLGDSSKLKVRFEELITEVLNCLLSGKRSSKYLVIQLDDTDLQFEHAYDILEDIRKHLALPNVVILMATDIDQLRTLVAQHYSKYIPNSEPEKTATMAGKYLDKLMPAQRTIYLPRFEAFCRSEEAGLQLTYGDHILNESFQEGVLTLIRKKTGIIFLKPSSYLHNIIPTTFRGLIHLLNLLASMEDIPDIELPENMVGLYFQAKSESLGGQKVEMFQRAAQAARRNLNLFENYFLYEWCKTKLKAGDYSLLIQTDIVAPNQRIRKLYSDICERNHIAPANPSTESDYIRLVRLLDDIGKKSIKESDYRFFFAVRTYLTIQFHRLMWRCRSKTLKECEQILQAGDLKKLNLMTFDYSALIERIGDFLFAENLFQFGAPAAPEYKRFSFDVNKNVDINNGSARMLLINCAGKLQFRMDRVFYGVLDAKNWQTQAIGNLYYAQEYSLSILLNWDVQNKIYKYAKCNYWDKEDPDENQLHLRYKVFPEFLSGTVVLGKSMDALQEKNRASFLEFLDKCGPNTAYGEILLTVDTYVNDHGKKPLERVMKDMITACQQCTGENLTELALPVINSIINEIKDYKKKFEKAEKYVSSIALGPAWKTVEEFCDKYNPVHYLNAAAYNTTEAQKDRKEYFNQFREFCEDHTFWSTFHKMESELLKVCSQV